MRLIKKQSKQTYVSDKTGKERHFYNFFIEADNGKRIQIKTVFADDVKALDMLAVYER